MHRWHLIASIVFVGAFPATTAAQEKSIPKSCVPDSAVQGSFAGQLERRTYPGPPKYESVTSGDTSETGYYLKLDGWACRPAPGDTVGVYSHADIEWIQVLLTEPDYARLRSYLGKHVRVTGALVPAESGHHHTLLILEPATPLHVERLDP